MDRYAWKSRKWSSAQGRNVKIGAFCDAESRYKKGNPVNTRGLAG
jgi:hypothetical protein